MRGPLYAAALAAAFLLGSMSVGLLAGLLLIPAGAIVGLATLREGPREALRVMLLAALAAAGLRFALVQQGLPVLVLAAVLWLPVWAMSAVLAPWRQQAYPLLLAALVAALYAMAMRLLVGDVDAFWAGVLQPLFDQVVRETGAQIKPEQLAFVARQLHAWSLVGIECMLAGMVLLGRYWQAVLFNPGGFGSEFRELLLPRWVSLGVALSGALLLLSRASVLNVPLAGDLFVILVVLFAFQGLAVIHYRVKVAALASGWLVALYIVLNIVPQVAGAILAMTGLVDNFADFRRLRRPLDKAAPH